MPDGTSTTYHGAHYYVRKRRGLARRYSCIDCGRPARQWSYDHADPNELVGPTGLEYSTDPSHYQPRCIGCHAAFDQRHRKSGVPQLHSLATELEPRIRDAIAQRDRARKRNDVAEVDLWDDELERLIAPLQAHPCSAAHFVIDHTTRHPPLEYSMRKRVYR